MSHQKAFSLESNYLRLIDMSVYINSSFQKSPHALDGIVNAVKRVLHDIL